MQGSTIRSDQPIAWTHAIKSKQNCVHQEHVQGTDIHVTCTCVCLCFAGTVPGKRACAQKRKRYVLSDSEGDNDEEDADFKVHVPCNLFEFASLLVEKCLLWP
jgi:hypothetical protein